jgi:hypothetical protein
MSILQLVAHRPYVLPDKHFKHATDGQLASQQTEVSMCFTDSHLEVNFRCLDNPFVGQNTYFAHNSDLWNQEVFELFIQPAADPAHYLEFEINPNGAIWIGRIHNPDGNGHVPADTQMLTPETSGISHKVVVEGETWSGQFTIPRSLIGPPTQHFRLNFYRIVALSPQSGHWAGSPTDCAYTCWNPTMSGTTPAFHRAAAMVEVWVEE